MPIILFGLWIAIKSTQTPPSIPRWTIHQLPPALPIPLRHLPCIFLFFIFFNLKNFYFVMFYIASSFPNRGNSNLQRYRDWSWLNCRRKLAYNFSLRTWKEVTQAKFASGYEDGFRWCYVRSCVVALTNLLANRFSATTMEKRCFGTAGGVFPLDRSHFLAGVLNFCSVYILWKI